MYCAEVQTLVVTADNAHLTNMSAIIVHSLEQVVVAATHI